MLAVDALERRAERLERATGAVVLRVGLELDAAAAPDVEGVAEQEQLGLDVRSGAPASGWSHVQPISTERCSGRSARNRVEPTMSSDQKVTSGISVPASDAGSACSTNA